MVVMVTGSPVFTQHLPGQCEVHSVLCWARLISRARVFGNANASDRRCSWSAAEINEKEGEEGKGRGRGEGGEEEEDRLENRDRHLPFLTSVLDGSETSAAVR